MEIRNDMRNKKEQIPFQKMTRGTYAFLWRAADAGYSLNSILKADQYQTDAKEVDQEPPWLVPKGELLRQYSPFSEPALHRKLAELDEADQKQILSFANRYGLLGGHECMLVPPNGGKVILGESLKRWQHEIQQMSLFIKIWDFVRYASMRDIEILHDVVVWSNSKRVALKFAWERNGGNTRISSYKKLNPQWLRNKPVGVSRGYEYCLLTNDIEGPHLLERWNQGDVVEPALYCVCLQVNKSVRNYVAPQVLPFRKNEVRLFPQTLLSAMWLMFMWEISGERKVALCPNCGYWFQMSRSDHRWCSNACKQAGYRNQA